MWSSQMAGARISGKILPEAGQSTYLCSLSTDWPFMYVQKETQTLISTFSVIPSDLSGTWVDSS